MVINETTKCRNLGVKEKIINIMSEQVYSGEKLASGGSISDKISLKIPQLKQLMGLIIFQSCSHLFDFPGGHLYFL